MKLTAKEAREKAYKIQLNEIYKQIKENLEHGIFHVIIDNYLMSDSAKKQLEKDGYQIIFNEYSKEYIITW